jgi:voltage-gated potassium channel
LTVIMGTVKDPFRRVWIGLGALLFVLVLGTSGYLILGFGLLDGIYQTVSTVTTVGFNAPHRLDAAGKAFTIVLILVGAGTALYTFSSVFEVFIDGHMRDLMRRRRMERGIDRMDKHVIVCGWGRVGQEVARFLTNAGRDIVVIDRNPDRLVDFPFAFVCGDVTVASKSMRPDLQVIARARSASSEPKLVRAGADRVVNPQQLGGDRMASFVIHPHVVDFVDVVMHDGTLKFRLEELVVSAESTLAGGTLRSAHLRDRTGALVLAIRRPDGGFVTNPSPEDTIEAGDVLISVGTAEQLATLVAFAT